VHEPFDPKPELLAKYRAKARPAGESGFTPEYAATIEAFDANVGRLMARIEALGLAKDTILIFTSDNGGTPGGVAPLRGSKGLLYEGGLRVPGFVHWPGSIPGGRVLDAPVASIDLAPTALEAAQASFPEGQKVDGASLLPVLLGKAPAPPARPLFWHFPCYIGKGEPMSLARVGDLKLIQKFAGPSFELYDLAADPADSRDLAKERPAKVDELRGLLAAWQAETGAFLADKPNPAFDPSAREPRGGGKGGRKPREGVAR
jgi:arylsulfatase A-like enzyme